VDPATLPYALLAAAVLLGFTAQTMAGFGGMVVALTLGAFLYPIPELLPVLIPASLFQIVVIAVRHWREVRWRLLLLTILPLMITGTIAGYLLSSHIAGPLLKRGFGVVVILFSIYELAMLRHREAEPRPPLPWPLASGGLLAAGLLQGTYATGGPPLVYVVGRLGLDKGAMRATLTMAFLPLNVGIVTGYILEGKITAEHGLPLGVMLVVVVVALALGEWLHGAIDEYRFRVSVFCLLLLAGVALLF